MRYTGFFPNIEQAMPTQKIPPPPSVGDIVKQARKNRNLTLERLAERCGVSKSMLSQIERGQVNPTFAVVWNLTQSLGLDLNLIGEQSLGNDVIEHQHSYSTPTRKSADGLCTLKLLSPVRTSMPVEWYEMTMEKSGELVSSAHALGTYEHFTCQNGSVRIESEGQQALASAGDTLRYFADRPHKIVNTAKGKSSGILLIASPAQYELSR